MQILSVKRSLLIFLFFSYAVAFSQDKPLGSETVIVVKPYTPSVNDAFKIKETPSMGDSVSLEKKPVKYSIFSVPVASTFTPSKGQATTVEREKRIKIYDNYATLGFGSFSNALAEFYTNLEVNRTDNFGVFLTHNSSQGGIDGVQLKDSYYDTALNLSYNSRNRKSSWNTAVGLEHQLYNWYGLPEIFDAAPETLDGIDPQHSFYGADLGGELNLYDSFFKKGSVKYKYFADSYKSSEHRFTLDGNFEVNIADELINTKISADVLSGKFDRSYFNPAEIRYTHMNFGITPSLLILRDDLAVNLGVSFIYGLDTENSDNSFYIYPQITASYRLADEYVIAYAGLEGDLEQNSYYDFTQENPFVSPTLDIAPTDKPYNASLGLKGKLSNSIAYNIRGNYIYELDKPLYLSNPGAPQNMEDYAYGNSFGVVYDELKTLSFFAELAVDVNRDFRLGINGTFYDYNSQFEAEAWNLPTYRASLTADYQITEKWFAGANFFLVGERMDREDSFSGFDTIESRTITLDSYTDLNVNLGYRFNDQLSIFARGNNLLGNNYEKWSNYPVLGLQVMAGATYKFDFK